MVIQHIKENTMIDLINRIFLRRKKSTNYDIHNINLSQDNLALLDTIKENADSITYQYSASGVYKFHIFSISKTEPLLALCSVCEINPTYPNNGLISYHFEQRSPEGILQKAEEGKGTDFAKRVYSEMFNTFVEHHGGITKKSR